MSGPGSNLFSDWELPLIYSRIRMLHGAGMQDTEILNRLNGLWPELNERQIGRMREHLGLPPHRSGAPEPSFPPQPGQL